MRNAEKTERMAHAIIAAIVDTSDDDDALITIGALGSGVGFIIKRTNDPESALEYLNKVASFAYEITAG